VLAGAFFYWLSDSAVEEETSPITELPAPSPDATIGRNLLVALAKLKSTTLDTNIFDDPVFMSLKDFGVEIAPQPVGRRNPFAEFGDSSRGKPSAASSKAVPPKAKNSTPSLNQAKTAPPKASQVEEGFDVE
jgi:hypothetical protein